MARPKRFNWWYSAIIDWMVANPGRKLGECARHFDKSQAWLSTVINSDMFKAQLAARKESFQQVHDFGLIEKQTEVANLGFDILIDAMKKKRDAIPIDTLVKISDTAMQRLGYGVKPPAGIPSVQVNLGMNQQVHAPVTAEALEAARNRVREVEQQKLLGLPQPQQAVTALGESSFDVIEASFEVKGPEREVEKKEEARAPIPIPA